MTLSYPYEFDARRLLPIWHAPVHRIDLEHRVDALVVGLGNHVLVAGCPLRVPTNDDALSLAARCRGAILQRFLMRRPNATEHTWTVFERVLQAELADRQRADNQLVPEILRIIDAL